MNIRDILKRFTKAFVLGLALLFMSTTIACADDLVQPRINDDGQTDDDIPPHSPEDEIGDMDLIPSNPSVEHA